MGRFHVVLLLLGCEPEDSIGMFSQNLVFVFMILDMTNGERNRPWEIPEKAERGKETALDLGLAN